VLNDDAPKCGRSLFTLQPLVDGMTMLKESISILSAPIDKLLAVEWAHCVDFKVRENSINHAPTHAHAYRI
jgi:hypothetical protein